MAELEQLWHVFVSIFPNYSWAERRLDSVTLSLPWPCERKSGCGKVWEYQVQWKWLVVEIDSLLSGRQKFQWGSGVWATASVSRVYAVHLSSQISKQNSNWPYTAGDTEIFMTMKLFFHWLCVQEMCGSVTLQVFPVVFNRSKEYVYILKDFSLFYDYENIR